MTDQNQGNQQQDNQQQSLRDFWRGRDEHQRGRWDFELPDWAQPRINYVRLGLAFLLGALALGGIMGCSASASSGWSRADSLVPEASLEQVVNENTSDLSEAERSELIEDTDAIEIAPDVVGLYFRSPLLTGQLGSLFVVYRLEGDSPMPLLQTYLRPDLPASGDYPLIATTDRIVNDLPCLHVHQVESAAPEVTRFEVCFDGNEYRIEEEIAIPLED